MSSILLPNFDVQERSAVELLREVDPWLDTFRRAATDKDAPPRFKTALRRVDEAIFHACRYGGAGRFAEILCALGNAECQLSAAERWRTEKRLQPLCGLSLDWIGATNDGSCEFELALALAGIHDAEFKIGSLRANLEPVRIGRHKDGGAYGKWADKDRSVVWNAAHLVANLARVLERRLMDSIRLGGANLPLAFSYGAALQSVAAFVAKKINEERIGELLWGLILLDHRQSYPKPRFNQVSDELPLPRTYALLKLLFLPKPLVVECRVDGIRTARFAHENEAGLRISSEPQILTLLRAGNVHEACTIAVRRLRASGLAPMSIQWKDLAGGNGLTVAASLLIPIPETCISELTNLVIRPEPIVQDIIA